MKKKNTWDVLVEKYGETKADLLVMLGFIAWYVLCAFVLSFAIFLGISLARFAFESW